MTYGTYRSNTATAKLTRRPRRASILRGALAATFAAVIGAAGCGTETTATTADYAYEDAYLYDYYYPADVAYAGAYGADAWDYATFVDAALGYSGTSATAAQRLAIGGAVRALIRGQSMCPGQVTVTPKTAAPPCAGSGATAQRDGITIAFNGCQITGGGMVTGDFDVQSNRSASAQTCSSTTDISLGFTTTITNLTYTSPDGAKLVIPSQVDTTSMSYTFGTSPTVFSINSNGELQRFDTAGTMISDHTSSGTRTITLSPSSSSYTIDGTVNVTDKINGGTAVLTGTGITRTAGCCRPTGGTLTVSRTGGLHPGDHTWVFESTCGAATFDGTAVTLPACI